MKAAVYTGTKNLYREMVTASKSLLINSDVDKIYLLVEDDEFPLEIPDVIKVINVKNQKWFPSDGPNMQTVYSYMAMIRVAFCHIFPELGRILSLDVDTIVDKDISDIWDLPIDDCYLAACHEIHRTHKSGLNKNFSEAEFMYCNAGVVLFNLEKLRNGKADEMIEMLNRRRYRWVDQDAMNYLCQGWIYDMPSDYNDNDWTVRPNAVKIKHYAGIKNWQNLEYVMKYRTIPWDEVLKLHEKRKGGI